MFRRIEHVQLAIPPGGEPAAEAYWCGVLGFTRLPKPATMAARGGAWFASGVVQVHVGVEDPFVPARKAHPAFMVDSIDVVAAAIADAGYPVRVSDEVPGTRRFHTDDPFGNRLEIVGS